MIVPLEERALPSSSYEEIGEFTRTMRDDGLVGFVMREIAPDAHQAFNRVTAAFAYQGYEREGNEPAPVPWGSKPTTTRPVDRAYHIDRKPVAGRASNVISLHYTLSGMVKAHLLEAREGVGESLPVNDLPTRFLDQIAGGEIDDEFFIPVLHTATLGEKDMLGFRLQGHRSVAHQFSSLTLPRNSVTIDMAYMGDDARMIHNANPLDIAV